MLKMLKVFTSDLEVGMFVSALDRPWLETPFIIQGFRIDDRDQIDRLQNYCQYVIVDVRKSQQEAAKLQRFAREERARVPIASIFPGRQLEPYTEASKFVEEYPRAQVALDSLMGDVSDVFSQVRDGKKVNVIQLRRSVEPIIDSISRNPDACLWLARLKRHDEYSYQHSLAASIWAVSLGRQLGLPRHDLRSLAMGGMLMDIGKLKVESSVLTAERGLDEEELQQVREHVTHGVRIIEKSGLMNRDVLDMVAHHHERYDGSGYPQGLAGDAIPPVARIAAIIDTYDAITTDRTHAQAVSPYDAIRELYQARDVDFQAELVEAFIQSVGLYPAGTLVELTSGEIGVVIAEYRTRRLSPSVMIILDSHKRRMKKTPVVDLHQDHILPDGQPLRITKSLEPGAFDIDLTHFKLPGHQHSLA